jgi:xanthine dehydrogenase accessory factor
MVDIIGEIGRLRQRGERLALASLIWSTGSIPMSDRAKMIITEDGSIIGTIGGGCLEAEVLSVGRAVLDTGANQHISYTMTEKQAGESGLNCGGTVRIYTELVEPGAGGDLYEKVFNARADRRGGVLATLLSTDSSHPSCKMWFGMDGSRSGSLQSAEAERLVEEKGPLVLQRERGLIQALPATGEQNGGNILGDSEMGKAAQSEVFIEPFLPEPILYVFGGGHVGGQIGALAKNVGFRVVIIDDRPAFANSERHPLVDECRVVELGEGLADLLVDDQSYLVAATRGHQHDEIIVEQAIKAPARYIGMLGSERKKLMLWKRIEGRGGQREGLDRVFAPIGVNIGADTPEEIAVSVVAELIAVRRGSRKVWKTKKSGAIPFLVE